MTEDPKYPLEDWQYEVRNGDTSLGYDEWLEHRKETESDHEEFTVPCGICGEDIPDGEPAYGTTTGTIEESCGGFASSDTDPWLTVACESCGQKISDAIVKLMGVKI